ncbi:MAG: mechanosensitive ion channel domain-containing protein [Pseudomonadota bacterium]
MTSTLENIARAICLTVICALLLIGPPTQVLAQDVTPDVLSDLSEEEFQAMLGRLSDEQVRDILIAEFAARRAEDPALNNGLMTNTRDIGETLTTNAKGLIAKWPELGDGFRAVGQRLSDAGGIGYAFLALLFSIGVGVGVRHVWRRGATQRQIAVAERNIVKGSYGSVATIVDAAFILVIELSSSIAFAVAALATLYLFFPDPDIRFFASSYIGLATVVLIVRSFVDFMFPINWPMYRLVALSDEAAVLVRYVVTCLAFIWMFEAVTSDVMAQFGAPAGIPDLFSLMIGLLWIVSVLLGVYLISRATAELLPAREERGVSSMLARNWAQIMAVVQILTWILFTGGALVFGNVDVIAGRVFYTILTFVGFWMSYRILIHYLRAQDMNLSVKAAIGNAARALLFAAGLLVVLAAWGLDPQALAASGTAGQVIQTIVNVSLTALVGWAIWDFIRTIIDVRTAAETPDEESEEGAAEGEGGLGASRTATLLPLLRSTALVVIGVTCLFAALSSLGVNVGPLVAGAGVIGLAVGFGAQTLVKDVVSGVFFLIDDAFRRGEYIDLGSVKGTVEKISVRSLQLRHHLGAVHTIPFGDIAALTNYSRDWVIMKLPLRLTFDTDPQKVKKIVKKIGAEFMEDELVNDGLLEPPKSQGVIQMEDSAMILRVKFKAVPGKQFLIRRELLHRIRAAFEEAGIRFASREVTVRVNEDTPSEERKEAISAAASRAIEEEQPATP